MATMILSTDFALGEVRISQSDNSKTLLDNFLTAAEEKRVVYNILGATLGQAFLDDLTGTPLEPQTAKWTAIYSQFTFAESDEPYTCIGLKEILKYYFYCKYVSQQPLLNTSNGNTGTAIESGITEGMITKVTIINNRMVDQINILQFYIGLDATTYPNFVAPYGKFQLDSGI